MRRPPVPYCKLRQHWWRVAPNRGLSTCRKTIRPWRCGAPTRRSRDASVDLLGQHRKRQHLIREGRRMGAGSSKPRWQERKLDFFNFRWSPADINIAVLSPSRPANRRKAAADTRRPDRGARRVWRETAFAKRSEDDGDICVTRRRMRHTKLIVFGPMHRG